MLLADAVLELDMKLYEEQHVELLSDMYSTGCELVLDTGTACFDRLLTKNICKCKTAEKLNLRQPERILQICHSTGEVKLDAAEPKEDGLHLEGVLEVGLLYLTDDDAAPVGYAEEMVPFRCTAEASGMDENSVYQLNMGLEQLTAVMLGSESVEVKGCDHSGSSGSSAGVRAGDYGGQDRASGSEEAQEMPGIVATLCSLGILCGKLQKNFTLLWIM